MEILSTVRKYGMRLNPANCDFRVLAGKFIRYMVTERGIEVSPLNFETIQEMSSPHALKEAQMLTRQIVALSWFMSRLAKWSLPFFKVLRNSEAFENTAECQSAFNQLKEFLISLPR